MSAADSTADIKLILIELTAVDPYQPVEKRRINPIRVRSRISILLALVLFSASFVQADDDCAKPNNDSVCRSKDRRPGSGAIDDQKLMFDEERFGDHGPSTTRSKHAGDCYEKVDENYGEITHH